MLAVLQSSAQLSESFSDGDFVNGISWSGNAGSWIVVPSSDVAAGAAGSNTLRLNAPSGSGIQYLSTQVKGSWGTQQNWGFWLGRRAQAATASNVSLIWLYANETDVSSSTVDGYRIKFGDDLSGGDKIILEVVNNGVGNSILSSAPVTNAITDFGLLVRISRNGSGQWSLYTSTLPTVSGSGALASDVPNSINANVLHGTATNQAFSILDDGYVAFAAVHSSITSARAAAEFDQLTVSFAAGSSLPVKFNNIQAHKSASGVQLDWENLTESGVRNYSIERSLNGKDFSEVATLNPLMNEGGRVTYHYTDVNFSKEIWFYRILAVETEGRKIYSQVLKISSENPTPALTIYPNPVRENHLQIIVSQLPPGNYVIRIYNSGGDIIAKSLLESKGNSFSSSMELNQLKKGWYVMEVKGGTSYRKQFVVQ